MKTYTRSFLLSSLAGLALCTSACSQASPSEQAQTPKTQTPLAASATETISGNWDIQAEGSHLRFTAEQEGKPFTGEFADFSGVIDFDPAAVETGSVKIMVPLKSVDAGSNDRNSTLPEKVWFSVKAFPTAVYTSSDISKQGDGFVAKGELTLKGVSVPLDFPFRLDVQGDTAVMTAKVEMDRTKWNVGAAPWDTSEWVSKVVTLDIKVTAEKAN